MDQVVFVDANIFLEVALRDAKHEACIQFFNDLISGKQAGYTSDFIVYTCLLQIQHKTKDPNKMQQFLIFLNSIANLKIIHCSLDEIATAIAFTTKYSLDFDDALVVSCMKHNDIKQLMSFDRDFDTASLTSVIKRIEP